MRRIAKFALCLCLAAAGPCAAGTPNTLPNTLTVRIDGVGSRGGILRVGIYTRSSYDAGAYKAAFTKEVRARSGTQSVTFVGIPSGVYAVKVVQDVDRSGVRNRTLLGSAREPAGYSGAGGGRGRPTFRDICFTVSAGDNKVIVHMRN